MTSKKSVAELINEAMKAAHISQRALAEKTEISQSTLSRILSADRAVKMPELIKIAWATGRTIAQLSGSVTVSDRVQCAARATDGAAMSQMRGTLLNFLELDEYLDSQAIQAS